MYDEIGLVNIADAVGDGNPYPQLSAEFIIAENPDLIFLACTLYCGETADTVAARPGWDSLDALANGGVIEMNDDVASRWGRRSRRVPRDRRSSGGTGRSGGGGLIR